MRVQLVIVLVIQAGLLVFSVVGGDLEVVELGSQGKGKIGPAAEILEVLGAGPEVLADIDGDEAAGGRGKEIAAGQVEDGADAAELVVVEPDLGKSQWVLFDLEDDPVGAVGQRLDRISDPVIIAGAERRGGPCWKAGRRYRNGR